MGGIFNRIPMRRIQTNHQGDRSNADLEEQGPAVELLVFQQVSARDPVAR